MPVSTTRQQKERTGGSLDRDRCCIDGVHLLEGGRIDAYRAQTSLGSLNPTPRTGGTNGTGRPSMVQLDRADASATSPVRSTPNHVTHCGAIAEPVRTGRGTCSLPARPTRHPWSRPRDRRAASDVGSAAQPFTGGRDGLDRDLAQRRRKRLDTEVCSRQHGDASRGQKITPPARNASA